ncbi:MAG: dipeptidase PepE [Sphingobacteriales bacterium]|jgi:dipeptidase E|nr:dipeptidase PepE [Sphingobacteriales bacterium]
MKNILLASTSTLFGGQYLDYLKDEIAELFDGMEEIVFIPFARPSGISHDDYTQRVNDYFSQLNIAVTGLHTFDDPKAAIRNAKGIFTGGGNTFLLVKTLHDLGLMGLIKDKVLQGMSYMGASAGTNIAGISMRTTNDMPIVYPSSFDTMGLVPFNINPHYLDPDPNSTHKGETRETRILEFLTQNNIPVVSLREGSWIRVKGDKIMLEGKLDARIFEQGKLPYELATGSELNFQNNK